MFKGFIFWFCFCLSFFWLIKCSIWITPHDKQNHQKFKDRFEESYNRQTGSSSYSRTGIKKHVWIMQPEGKRLQIKLESVRSQFTPSFLENKKISFQEQLYDVQCWIQDKFLSEGAEALQRVRFFQSTIGSLDYTTGQFFTPSAKIYIYQLTGDQLPENSLSLSPILQGKGEEVYVTFDRLNPVFQAHRFKAIFEISF